MGISIATSIVEKALASSPKKAGSFNVFCKISKDIGVKGSISKAVRDSNYERQEKAAKHELGPEVYGKVDFVYEDVQFYGYLTELVPTCVFDGNKKKKQAYSEFHDEYEYDLKRELKEKIGFDFSDSHQYNTGIKNKKLICIDFDNVFENFRNSQGTRLPQKVAESENLRQM